MTDLPEPLTPADCDLRGMEWMPLHGHKLYGSDFDAIASDAEYRAAQRLWWAAWQQQVPAASLPDDDRVLSSVAGFKMDQKGWQKIKEVALHAFVKCSDGRLYHRFLAPEALIAWDRRVKERDRKAAYRAKRDGTASNNKTSVPRDTTRDDTGTDQFHNEDVPILSHVDNTTQDRTGQFKKERKKEEVADASASAGQKRGSRLPDDWQVSPEDRQFCASRGLNVEDTIGNFCDYWHSKPGRDGLKLDWPRTFRVWCRSQKTQAVQPKFKNGFAQLLSDRHAGNVEPEPNLPSFLRMSHVPN